MRASSILAILGLAVSSVDARAYNPRSSRALGGLLAARETTDTCASLVNAPLKVTLAGAPAPVTIGLITTCLCLSGIPLFAQTNVVAVAATSVAGQAATVASLTSMITSSSSSRVCTYPDNAVPVCSTSSPCGFTCGNGFSLSQPGSGASSTCVCQPPAAVCNGVCTTDACPSSVVTPARRRYMNSLRKRAMCPAGTTACAVYERRGASSTPWECIDTMSDLESCGGCVNPLDAFSPRGADCTAIPGVVDVACVSGACVVNRCAAGYTHASDGSSCFSVMLEQD
ncbi:hypothetical protein C8T65DRAFT_104117 [Cerioporus squamosus]|nr:hypothetical protein C8T65DRAFT_104117 [Cerioporus squamosus]